MNKLLRKFLSPDKKVTSLFVCKSKMPATIFFNKINTNSILIECLQSLDPLLNPSKAHTSRLHFVYHFLFHFHWCKLAIEQGVRINKPIFFLKSCFITGVLRHLLRIVLPELTHNLTSCFPKNKGEEFLFILPLILSNLVNHNTLLRIV